MNESREKLVAAGRAARAIRMARGWGAPAYARAIAEIDRVTGKMRAEHPEKFWHDDDPAYQKLTKKWAHARALAQERRHENGQ